VYEEGAVAFSRISGNQIRSATSGKKIRRVRTTSYSDAENEKGGIYGRKNAIGINLKYGAIRSAAADWSRYPLGTKFRIVGEPYMYVIDDYGSGLVGTDTIDIYKPNLSMMKAWGVRHLDIEILEWGSYRTSLKVLADRRNKAAHCREMYDCIVPKLGA
jgi:3D (Asp-Asp-Asp) domain-containing protein